METLTKEQLANLDKEAEEPDPDALTFNEDFDPYNAELFN